MSDFDNYFGYWSAMKYGDLMVSNNDQPVDTVQGANETLKEGIMGDMEPGYLHRGEPSEQELADREERDRRLRGAALMPADVAAGLARGYGEGLVGFPGDLVSLVRASYNMAMAGADQSKLEAFINGLDLATGIPTTQDMSDWLDENIGPIVPGSAADDIKEGRENLVWGSQLTGEILAPVPWIRLGVKGAKKGMAKIAERLDQRAKARRANDDGAQ